jgi:hypothetical protein
MQDTEYLAGIIQDFFKAFVSKDIAEVDLDVIKRLFIPQALIVKTCGSAPVIYTLNEFIEPRQKILTDGTLSRFQEKAVSTQTEIFGDIAHSFVLYQKSGVLAGKPFDETGMKTIQFIRTLEGWKISSLAWDDERAGLVVPEKYRTL